MRSLLPAFAITAAFLINLTSTQAQSYDKRLTAKYGAKELAKMAENDAEGLAYLTFYLDNGYQIADVPKGKEDGVKESVKLKGLEAKDINLLALNIPQHDFARQYYLIEGIPGKMLIHLPKDEVEAAFKNASK